MTLRIDVVTDIEEVASEAAELVANAFPIPFLEMDERFITWALRGSFNTARPGCAAVARDDGRMVGFIGAAPRPLVFGDVRETAYVATFLATDQDARGSGLATVLYGTLLDHLGSLDAPVLTYTVGGSIADLVTAAAYRRAGFVGQPLESLVTWGAIRDRLRPGPANETVEPVPTLALERTTALEAHLAADPRGARALAGGAEVVAAWRTAVEGRDPVIIVDIIPSPLDAASLTRTVEEAFAAFPGHGRQLTMPGVPEHEAGTARAAGLRRVALTPYKPTVWARDRSHPFLRAQRTTHPIL